MLRFALVLSYCPLTGCFGGGKDIAYDEPTFIDAYVEVMCGLEIRCYEDVSPFANEQECQNAADDFGYPSFGDGCTFDREAASLCIDEFDRSGCIDYFERLRPDSCEEVFSGDCAWHDRDAETAGE